MDKVILIKYINDVKMYKEVEGRHYFIYVGDKFAGSDIFERDAVEKFNRAVLTGKVV